MDVIKNFIESANNLLGLSIPVILFIFKYILFPDESDIYFKEYLLNKSDAVPLNWKIKIVNSNNI